MLLNYHNKEILITLFKLYLYLFSIEMHKRIIFTWMNLLLCFNYLRWNKCISPILYSDYLLIYILSTFLTTCSSSHAQWNSWLTWEHRANNFEDRSITYVVKRLIKNIKFICINILILHISWLSNIKIYSKMWSNY